MRWHQDITRIAEPIVLVRLAIILKCPQVVCANELYTKKSKSEWHSSWDWDNRDTSDWVIEGQCTTDFCDIETRAGYIGMWMLLSIMSISTCSTKKIRQNNATKTYIDRLYDRFELNPCVDFSCSLIMSFEFILGNEIMLDRSIKLIGSAIHLECQATAKFRWRGHVLCSHHR